MLYLKEAQESDLELMMSWRSNPLVFQGFYTQTEPLKWDEHLKWWQSRQNWKTFIITLVSSYRERKIGAVTLGQLDHWSPEIGYYIGEITAWGKGYGQEAVKLAMNWLKERGYRYCHTTVKTSNGASAHLLWKLGFQVVGGARENELWLTKKL